MSLGILFSIIFLISYGLTIVVLYIGYTPVGLSDVQGLQTRYWLPILIFLMMLISMLKVENKIKNHERMVAFFMGIGIV